MMKANELTPGDWLYYRGRFNAFPLRVEQVTRRKVGYHAEPHENRMYYLRLHEVEPIALTSETLERNGFKYYHKNFASLSYEDPFRLKMVEWPDENGLGGLWTLFDIIEIRFVHELQHALKLCKIDKEITL